MKTPLKLRWRSRSLSLLSVFVAHFASARGIVRLETQVCADPSKKIISSGILLKDSSRLFVLSSDSSVLRTADCYKISQGSSESEAKLIKSDWGRGLALLELQFAEPFLSDAVAVSEIEKVRAPELAPYQLEAWSEALNKFAVWTHVRALAQTSYTHFFADVETIIDLSVDQNLDPALDQTVVGSGLFNSKKTLVGIMSNQYIQMIPGQASRPAEWTSFTKTPGETIIIPGLTILEFLQAQDSPYATDPMARFLGKPNVRVGGFEFSLDCPSGDPAQHSGQGYPIGGTDPIGIGGDTQADPACKNSITVDSNSSHGTLSSVGFSAAALRLQELFDKGAKQIESNFLYRRSSIDDGLERKLIYSLGQFFRVLSREPTWKLHRVPDQITGIAANWQSFRDQANLVAKEIYTYPPSALDGSKLLVLRPLFLFTELLRSYDSTEVRLPELDAILDQNGPYQIPWWLMNEEAGAYHRRPLHDVVQPMRDSYAKLLGGS